MSTSFCSPRLHVRFVLLVRHRVGVQLPDASRRRLFDDEQVLEDLLVYALCKLVLVQDEVRRPFIVDARLDQKHQSPDSFYLIEEWPCAVIRDPCYRT